MKIERILKNIFQEMLREMETNGAFRDRIIGCIKKETDFDSEKPIRTHRRKPGPFDPMLVYSDQPDALKARLSELSINELKDIIAEHGMDRSRLALKWKSKERLTDLIITTVHNRSQKGDAFRSINTDQKKEDVERS